MNRVCSLHELRLELKQLGQWRERLAGRLLDAADRLDGPGEPPTDELIDDLVSYRVRIRQLADDIGIEAVATDDGAETDITLAELGRLLDARERRERVLQVLDEVLKWQHVETPDFAPLALCQAEARRLKELSSRSHEMEADAELVAICQQTHPLNLLLKLCEQGNGLSDSDWIECNDRVTAAYGRQLATALARGRILRVAVPAVIEPSPAPMASYKLISAVVPSPANPIFMAMAALPLVIDAARELIPAKQEKPRLGADSIFEPSPFAESVFEERTPPPKLRGLMPPHEDSPLTEQPAPAPLPSGNAIPGSAIPSEATPPALCRGFTGFCTTGSLSNGSLSDGSLSNGSLSGSSAKAVEPPGQAQGRLQAAPRALSQVSELAVQLLSEDRLPLAMHVARCAELRPGLPIPFPPTWLLRSLILGEHLSDSRGELARQLDDDLRNFRPELLTDGDEDRQLASGFLLRAAALPAALISGSTSASAILRAFKISPGCSQLYNYCSRIAFYGDRLDGQIVEMFRPQSADLEDLDTQSLGETASHWLQEMARKATNYGRTSPLFLHAHWTLTASTSIRHSDATQIWCKWQETLLLASRLLRPVCHDLEGERHWVRQELARLSAQVRVESNAAGVETSARGNALPTEEMHAVLHQAIELASRWLRLSGAKSAQAAGPVSQDALDLRDEVLERTAGVLNELNEQWQAHTSPLVRAGIACCCRSVDRIHSLFDGSRSLPLQETDLRHALHAELLKIPGLELNDQWLPETDPATLERELIEHLKRGDTSWRRAYEVQALHGDHVATGRLLELDVWSSETERDELRGQRDAQIAEHRQSLARELNEVSIDLEAVGCCGQLDEAEGDIIARRLERLHRDLPKLLNFGSCRWELDQIRSALQRLRAQPFAGVTLGSAERSPANLEPRRSRMVCPALSDRANEPLAHETSALVIDIFSEE